MSKIYRCLATILLGFLAELSQADDLLARSFECHFANETADGLMIGIDTELSTYVRVPATQNDEEGHIEGSVESDVHFSQNGNAIAAVVHILGLRQQGTVTPGEEHLATFQMNPDLTFVEVFDGAIGQGKCTVAENTANIDPAQSETSSTKPNPFSHPWKDSANAIVLDPFQGNALDWDKIKTDPRVGAVIHKASQGLGKDGKYAERKNIAKQLGYLWGSYHLLTNADTVAQIDQYLNIVGVDPSESRAVDVECLTTSSDCQSASFKVSFEGIETALRRVKEKTGSFPLLYANNSVTKALTVRWKNNDEFAGVKLWYARYKDVVNDFPKGVWENYTLWQFSSEANCNSSSCPYRVPGTQNDLDLNIYFGTISQLKSEWPLEK